MPTYYNFKERYGEWALVTGGHSGIGFCLAEQLAADGVNVVISARTQKSLDEASARITAKHKVQVRTVAADCSTTAGVTALIDAVKDLEIAILVPNAGVEHHGYFAEQDPATIEQTMFLNVMAPTMLARHYMKLMGERGCGAILFVSSILGLGPAPFMAVYAATKAYVISLAESTSAEMSGTGVDVTVLSPGVTDTPMARNAEFLQKNPGFPVDTPDHTAAVGLWAIGRRAHRIPLLMNRIACLITARLMPGWMVRTAYRTVMAGVFSMPKNPFAASAAAKKVR